MIFYSLSFLWKVFHKKDSRVLGHLFRRAGVKHFYQHSITGIDPPELIYFQRSNFQQYRDAGYLTYDVMYRKSMWQLMLEKKRYRRFGRSGIAARN